ncbi:tRNA lysidine(34) synthetase TilS [Antribacter sp. KLBMP9083]|uniref:tRNA(Ile)-lysidine synthase n=1 Tax=Antribacter soli TaxID=2910976 RepID=A0AA41QES6_9MICO|nr:tRNA lysidine(34) synthetase TilS [Antribacter soli]MCF4122134.1 tRNA lysidine(34) synthetase TilS [Antribacter soli]
MGRVDPAVAAARSAARAALAGLPEGALVLVACSGGADSLALAATLAVEAGRVGKSVRSPGYAVRAGAVVVDHGLQPGSERVAARAADQCRELGLDPVEVRRVHPAGRPASGSDGPEGEARRARYAALEEVAVATGATLVLLGHTLDDQAEQVLLGLARGSGARSLAGMPRERGVFRRPFLGLRRTQTEAVCAALGLDWWTDPTNLLPDDVPLAPGAPVVPAASAALAGIPLRTRVRRLALPVLEEVLGPGVAEALARTADGLSADADALDALAHDLMQRARVPAGEDAAGAQALDVATLADAPAALRRRALRLAAAEAGVTTSSRHVDALDALVVSWRGQGPAHLPGDARAWRAYGRLLLRPAPPPGTTGSVGEPGHQGTTQE